MRRFSLLALICLSTPAAAQDSGLAFFQTGNDLHADCSSITPSDRRFCEGYAMGAFDGMVAATDLNGITIISPPKKVTGRQVTDIVTQYLREHPEHRHFPAGALVYIAIREVWPAAAEAAPQKP